MFRAIFVGLRMLVFSLLKAVFYLLKTMFVVAGFLLMAFVNNYTRITAKGRNSDRRRQNDELRRLRLRQARQRDQE